MDDQDRKRLSEVGEIKEVTNTCTSKFKIND